MAKQEEEAKVRRAVRAAEKARLAVETKAREEEEKRKKEQQQQQRKQEVLQQEWKEMEEAQPWHLEKLKKRAGHDRNDVMKCVEIPLVVRHGQKRKATEESRKAIEKKARVDVMEISPEENQVEEKVWTRTQRTGGTNRRMKMGGENPCDRCVRAGQECLPHGKR